MKKLQFKRKTKLPMILQNEIAECGHACIAMISNYFGHELNLTTLRQEYKTSSRGISLYTINQIIENLNFKTRALMVPVNEISYIKCPAIIHLNTNHFVVLKSVSKKHIILHDPATGVCRYSINEFVQIFSGVVLEIETLENFQVIRNKQKLTLVTLLKNMSGCKKWLAILLWLSLIIELFNLTNPLLLSYITDEVTIATNINQVITIACGVGILLLLHTVTEYTRSNLILFIRTHLAEALSAHTFKHLLSLPLSFFENRHRGDLQAKFQSIQQIQAKVSTDFVNTLLDGGFLILHTTIMFCYSWKLAVITIISLCLQIIYRYCSYHTIKHNTALSLRLHAKHASTFLETLHAIQPLKTFIKERMQFHNWHNSYIDATNTDILIAKAGIKNKIIQQLITNIEYLILICVGTKLIITHQLSIGMLIACLGYRLLVINKSASFIQNILEYRLISLSLERLSDILFHQPENIEQKPVPQLDIRGTLQVCNLSFKYSEDQNYIFSQLNLTIHAGEKIVITGPSGCGKSTLLKILMGLVTPTSGSILIDNMPIHEYGINNYRQLIGSVMQNDTLLSGSILENITFFSAECDYDLVYNVAKIAQIDDTIRSFPMGYHTLVGELGASLSGGQKQRILTARALYKKPKILILDEATSHLDLENEIKLNQALRELNITQICVAHRQESIKTADRVFTVVNTNIQDCPILI